MSKVFISYSHVDAAIANDLATALTELGVEHFLDVKDINWSDAITFRIRESLDGCIAIVVIISPASLKSHWVPYEIGYASALRKPILPFLTHPSLDIPHYISDINSATTVEQVRDYFTNKFRQLQQIAEHQTREALEADSGLSQFEIEVLRDIGRTEEDYVRAELMAKVIGLPEKKIELCLKALQKRGFLSELRGPWSGAYELLDKGREYLYENDLI